MQTKKHFIAVAKLISEHRAQVKCNASVEKQMYGENMLDDIARDFAIMFADENPNFDLARFYVACGLKPDGQMK